MRFTTMIKKVLVINLLIILFSQLTFGISYAIYPEHAEVLPKGRSSVRVDSNFFFRIDEKYNPDGDAENIAADYNTSLNTSIFPALAVFGSTASIGNSIVSSKFYIIESYSYYYYGVTDKLTVGFMIPYWWVKNEVDARVDSSNATVGKSALADSLVPLPYTLTPDEVPLTTEDVQNLLGGGLDVAGNGDIDVTGYGYKRVETWSGNGISDIEAGFKYQYFKNEDWRLAFTGGVRFPTGEVDDPDNLMDYEFGSGAYALLFRLQNDYAGIKKFVINSTFKYDLVLPDKATKRVPSDVNRPITNNKEEVRRDLGDKFQIEVSGKYPLLKGLDLFALYNYRSKLKDQISGDNPSFNYGSLEAETMRTEHIYEIGLIYTTLPLYMEKKFPFPFTASVSYRDRFAGSDNPFDSQYIGLVLQGFF